MVVILDMSNNEWEDYTPVRVVEQPKVAQPAELPALVPRLVPVAEDRTHHTPQRSPR